MSNIRQKFNLWMGGEQTWPKIDYLSLQSEDKALNLSALDYCTERINKLWLLCFCFTVTKLVVLVLIYFRD